MNKFEVSQTTMEGLLIVTPRVWGDHRGYFMETYHSEEYQLMGVEKPFVQDNESFSSRGVLRGLHFQRMFPQAKLVRVTRGEVFDVAVDLRPRSRTFGNWFGVVLTESNHRQFYIPEGFAHGFLVLSDVAQFVYKCTDFYHPEDEAGVFWKDPAIGIEWPVLEDSDYLLSEKDKKWPTIKEANLG